MANEAWRLNVLPNNSLQVFSLPKQVFTFDRPIAGPIAIGRGRYVGFGVLWPVEDAANLKGS